MPSLVDGTARPLTAPEPVERAPLAILAGDADAEEARPWEQTAVCER